MEYFDKTWKANNLQVITLYLIVSNNTSLNYRISWYYHLNVTVIDRCYICLAEYEEGDKIRVLPCHHEYHMSCVDKWLKEIHGYCHSCPVLTCLAFVLFFFPLQILLIRFCFTGCAHYAAEMFVRALLVVLSQTERPLLFDSIVHIHVNRGNVLFKCCIYLPQKIFLYLNFNRIFSKFHTW